MGFSYRNFHRIAKAFKMRGSSGEPMCIQWAPFYFRTLSFRLLASIRYFMNNHQTRMFSDDVQLASHGRFCWHFIYRLDIVHH